MQLAHMGLSLIVHALHGPPDSSPVGTRSHTVKPSRYLVMGAGEVGFHLARSLSEEGHEVTVIERDAAKVDKVKDALDAHMVIGNGAHRSVLETAGAASCDLFMAVSSSDEANLVASVLAEHLGAKRCVVRVGSAEEVITNRKIYEEVLHVDLLLSTQLLTTTRILNKIRGHNTMGVEYLAGGKVHLHKIHLDEGSSLVERPLKEVELPPDGLVVSYLRGDEAIVPSGDTKAMAGDDALILGTAEAIAAAERMLSRTSVDPGTVVIAGGGSTAFSIARVLQRLNVSVKIIEGERQRAEQLARTFPSCEVLLGDATDEALLRAERVDLASSFVALTGHDESNLMACLVAQDLGVPQVLALVQRSETSTLWRRMGLTEVFSPRQLAYERIKEYIASGYSANIVSLKRGHAVVMERELAAASPAAGVTLAEMNPPHGVIVGAVVRDDKVFVPRGRDRLKVGDLVILFVHQEELDTVRLLFPGVDRSKAET
jgi:trk system potassium uptake protein TrkA